MIFCPYCDRPATYSVRYREDERIIHSFRFETVWEDVLCADQATATRAEVRDKIRDEKAYY